MRKHAADRREFLKSVGVTVGATVAAGLVGAESSALAETPPARPNVLFIAVDDLRPDLSCYGDPCAITPHIDNLAERGTRFARAYCQQAVCNPSRQSLMTGRRPDSIKVWDLKTHFRKTSPGMVTLAEHFKNNGYFAQSVGKIFHGEAPMADPSSWSVPEQFEYTPKVDDYRLPENHVSRKAQKADVLEFVEAGDDDYPDGKVAHAAVEAIERFAKGDRGGERDRPFFLAVGMRKPHLPFTAPRRYWDMYGGRAIPPIPRRDPPTGAPALALHNSVELRGYIGVPDQGPVRDEQAMTLRRGYYASLTYTDAQIGRVLDALKRTGLEKDTIIVFWVDHGFHLGELGLWCKTTNYENDTHVPLIVVDPSRRKGDVCREIVELIDVFPTLCELCHLSRPAQLEGKSLMPWLNDSQLKRSSMAYSQFPRPWFYSEQPEYMGCSVRTESHRYVEWRRFATKEVVERELYDMRDGRTVEEMNLAAEPDQKARVAELGALLKSIFP